MLVTLLLLSSVPFLRPLCLNSHAAVLIYRRRRRSRLVLSLSLSLTLYPKMMTTAGIFSLPFIHFSTSFFIYSHVVSKRVVLYERKRETEDTRGQKDGGREDEINERASQELLMEGERRWKERERESNYYYYCHIQGYKNAFLMSLHYTWFKLIDDRHDF